MAARKTWGRGVKGIFSLLLTVFPVVSVVPVVPVVSFRLFRSGGFVSVFRVLVHANLGRKFSLSYNTK